MRLTIIRVDAAVYIDFVAYDKLDMSSVPLNVHALQWFDVNGWIEFNDGTANLEITELPSWVDTCVQEWEAADYRRKNPPPPPPPTAEENKHTAMNLLAQTDWTALSDVADPLKSNPYLSNANEFNAYRNAVRQIAIAPFEGELVWPTKPVEVWLPGTN